jgi:hypothetical protein
MITLEELTLAQQIALRQVKEGRLTFRARHGHGSHYVWAAESTMPRTAYAAEIAIVQSLIVLGVLVEPDVAAGVQVVSVTPLGESLYRRMIGEPTVLVDQVRQAAVLVRTVYDALVAEEKLADNELAACTALTAALRYLGYARRDLAQVPR